ncbi:hypothetical protein HanPI659440_Chr04g0178801 [Helianthus annuus]|nr:hypothetical protein HanPI659440_Chr04g0178801 [Helianthus annuus]
MKPDTGSKYVIRVILFVPYILQQLGFHSLPHSVRIAPTDLRIKSLKKGFSPETPFSHPIHLPHTFDPSFVFNQHTRLQG